MKDRFSEKQKQAVKEIKAAFKKAQKLGLCFLAKGDQINAYRRPDYAQALPLQHNIGERGEPLPYIDINGCILDSGADDMEYFRKER